MRRQRRAAVGGAGLYGTPKRPGRETLGLDAAQAVKASVAASNTDGASLLVKE